ncbi:hypothetical protein JW960_07435 [candidate division KSB1 bacterium]|nr:hypothetical protein [candidate division KSB1 bacterium]
MNKSVDNINRERFNILMMGALDNELSFSEKQEFEKLINEYAEFRTDWQEYKQLKEVTQSMKLKSPPDEVWDNYWMNVYNRIERGIAWIVFSIGAVILITYGLFKTVESIIADSQIETIIKIGIIALLGGLVLLVVSVFREKLRIRISDPYKEIKR